MNPRKTLLQAFSCWTEEERGNIRWHIEKKTKILCGCLADEYVLSDGETIGAWPAVLMGTREVSKMPLKVGAALRVHTWISGNVVRMRVLGLDGFSKYIAALRKVSETELREIFKEASGYV